MGIDDFTLLLRRLRKKFAPKPSRWVVWVGRAGKFLRRKRLSDGSVKEYSTWRMTIPTEKAEELEISEKGDQLLVIATRLRWFHYFDWGEDWENLPEETRAEQCLAGLGPRERCRDVEFAILVGSREEFRSLGIKPGETVSISRLMRRKDV